MISMGIVIPLVSLEVIILLECLVEHVYLRKLQKRVIIRKALLVYSIIRRRKLIVLLLPTGLIIFNLL